LERLGSVKLRKGTRHWVGEGAGEKALNAHAVVDPSRWADDLVDHLVPVLSVVGKQHANRLARKLKAAGILDDLIQGGKAHPAERSALGQIVGNQREVDRLIAGVMDEVENMIRESAMRQSQRVQEVVQRMEDDGESLDDIKREIRKMVSTRGSWRKGLAIHATTAAIEGVKGSLIDTTGDTVTKTWKTRNDHKVRDTHRMAEGQTRKGGKPFLVGGFPMRWPGDPLAPIELVINCRCYLEVNYRG
jgi:hypothetical protein